MKGVFDIYKLPVGEKLENGVATITAKNYNHSRDPIQHMRDMMNGMGITNGNYITLHVDRQLMMSDTDMEKSSNRDFVRNAKGDVFIAGLGIGLIVHNILHKPDVTSITIIEKYQDVINLVSPFFSDPRIKFICGDVMEYMPAKDEKYDTIYFDIWAEISIDNLDDIKKLHNRWKSRKRAGGWMNSWMKERLQRDKRNETRYW